MWLLHRKKIANTYSGDALFISIQSVNGKPAGLPATPGGWRKTCADWAKRAGIPHFSPHSFRRGFAYYYHVVRGLSVDAVMKAGRWKSFDVFKRFLVGADVNTFLNLLA